MTIHADWISQFKDWAPDAFNAKSDPAFEPGQEIVGFIDGQIKLMGMPRVVPEHSPVTALSPSASPFSAGMDPNSAFAPAAPMSNVPTTTWSTFLEAQFAHPIQRLWRLGARRVVLAFDDYENVPKGKAITQASRRARHSGPPFVFHAEDPLPPFPPTGEDWTKAMSNRAFKARVQQLILESLPVLLTPPIPPTPHYDSSGNAAAAAAAVIGAELPKEKDELLGLLGHAEHDHGGEGKHPDDDAAPQPDLTPDAPGGNDGDNDPSGEQAGGPAQEDASPPEVPQVQPEPAAGDPAVLITPVPEAAIVPVVLFPYCPPSTSSSRPPFQVIVDWRGPVLVEFSWNADDGVYEGAESHRPRAQIGEADIKFAHWTRAVNEEIRHDEHHRGTVVVGTPPPGQKGLTAAAPRPSSPPLPVAMAVLATDGDFIPIALLLPEHIPIHILRIEKRMDAPHPKASVPAPHHNGMEWVDIRGLRAELLKRNIITMMGTPARDPHSPGISPLIVLIALTGTDYSRNLPSIGPKTILKKHGLTSALRLARSALALPPVPASTSDEPPASSAAAAAPIHLLDVDAAAHSLVASLYASTYHQHTLSSSGRTASASSSSSSPSSHGAPRFNSLLELLCRNTRLSEKTRARLPSLAQVRTTLRNANFLLQYWRGLLVGSDSSIDPRHGFRENPATGAVEWDDDN